MTAVIDEKKLLKKVKLPKSDALTFIGKYDTERKQELTVNNTTDSTIAFKIKITAPKLTRLQPVHGYVKPKDKAIIRVTAKSYNDGPTPPSRERVVVLLTVAPDNHTETPAQFWKSRDPKDPRRVVFPLIFLEEWKPGKGKGKEEKKEEEASEESGSETSSEESDADESD